jgi:hypothetical protein
MANVVLLPTPVVSALVTVPPGNAFAIAAKYLNDPLQVDRIMAQNPTLAFDPWFATITTLTIPPVKPGAGTGGIFGPIL